MKFSILIPAYKATFLKECIESILSQTYTDFEVIIVDDASPEDLKSIIDKFPDDRIHYYRNEQNCGAVNVVDNWNNCLNYSKGEYVICMGDDDKLLPNCLEEYCKLIELYPHLNVYHGWTEIIDENSTVHKMQEARPLFEGVFSMMWHRFRGRVQYIGDFLYRASYLKAKKGFYKLPLAWGADDITAYIAAESYGIANTQVPVFQYRENGNSITNSGNIPLKIQTYNEVKELCRKIVLLANPISNVERVYQQLLNKNLEVFISHTISYYLYIDLKKSFKVARVFFWLLHKRRYNITFRNIIIGFVKSMFV